MFKQACAHELRDLLNTWNGLQLNPNATQRDYKRVGEKIKALCSHLDRLERLDI